LLVMLAMSVYLSVVLAPTVYVMKHLQPAARVEWSAYLNPSGGEDTAYGVCVFGGHVVAAGEAGGRPYAAMLERGGAVANEWFGGWPGAFYNCVPVGKRLYVTGVENGSGVIYVFDERLDPVARVEGAAGSAYLSAAYDGRSLYVAGWAGEDVDGDGAVERVWLVERRAPDDLTVINAKRFWFGTWKEGWVLDVGVDVSTGMVWAVGFYVDAGRGERPLVVAFNRDLEVLKVIGGPEGGGLPPGRLYSVVFDGGWHVYVSGEGGVATFTMTGELVAVKSGVAGVKAAYANGSLATFADAVVGGYWKHLVHIHRVDLSVAKEGALDRVAGAGARLLPGKTATDGAAVYVAGVDHALGGGDTRIVVHALSVRSAEDYPTLGDLAEWMLWGLAPFMVAVSALAMMARGR